MQLFLNDAEGRTWEVEVETDEYTESYLYSGKQNRSFAHRITVKPAIDTAMSYSTDQADGMQVIQGILSKAKQMIKDWEEGKK